MAFLTEARVLSAGLHVAADIYQGVAGQEGGTIEDGLTDILGKQEGSAVGESPTLLCLPSSVPKEPLEGPGEGLFLQLGWAYKDSCAVVQGCWQGVLALLHGSIHLLHIPKLG